MVIREIGRAKAVVAAGVAALLLTACVPAQDAADQIVRDQARTVINAEVERQFPGADVSAITDCVIDNASAQEILTIAGGLAIGNEQLASETVTTVLQRPSTIECTARSMVPGLGIFG